MTRILFEEAKSYLLRIPFIKRINGVYDVLVCRPSLMGNERNNIPFEDILNRIERESIPLNDLQRRFSKRTAKIIEQTFGNEFDGLAQALSPDEESYNLYLDGEDEGDEYGKYVKRGTLIVTPDIGQMFEGGIGIDKPYLRDSPEETCATFLDFTLRQSLVYGIANELDLDNNNGLGFGVSGIESVLDFNPLLLGMWKYDKVVNSVEYRQKLDELIEQVNKTREDIY